MLTAGLLGPIALWRNGEEVELRGARQRTLVAALAIDAGRVVPADGLVERVWGDRLPAAPGNALQQLVLKVRRAAGEDAVAYEPPGYRLAVPPDAVDARRLEDLLERARAADAPAATVALLDEAAALWRGPALADVAHEYWAVGPAARLEELRLEAEDLRAGALVSAGRPGDAVAALERLVCAEPLREGRWSALMLALYVDGRQSDALAAFGRARAHLLELGLEPGTALRTLQERILQQDPTLHAPRAAAVVPEPERLPAALARYAGGDLFVGRADELLTLRAAWSGAQAGGPRCVLVSGEPGAGKTRLVAELAGRLHRDGALVVHGRCEEDVSAPYGGVVSALEQLAAGVAPDVLAPYAGTLGRIVESLSGAPPPPVVDPDTDRLRLHEAAVAVVAAASVNQPVLVVLDDLHWADRSTLALLLHLLRGPEVRVLVVGTLRDTALDRRAPVRALLGDLMREPATQSLALPALTETDVAALADAILGPSDAALSQAVHRETRGNALFATELLRHLATERRDVDDDGAFAVPPTVRELAVGRLEQIGHEAADVLLAATVVGPQFDLDVLELVTGRPDDALIDALDRAGEAALVYELPEPPGRFTFSHALLRSALTETLSPARRRLLHRKVAEALAGLEGLGAERLGELARHWIEGGDELRGLAAAERAGEAALEMLDPDGAERWFREALQLHEASGNEVAGRTRLLARLGEAERRAGADGFREHLLEAGRLARELGDGERLAQAALANNRGMHSQTGVVDTERLELLEAALELRRDDDDALRALLLATVSSELWSGDHDRRLALSDEAMAVARRAGDDRVLAEVIYRRTFAIAEPATLAERLALTAEMVAITDMLDDPLLCLLASVERSRAAMESADLPEAVAHAHRQAELAARCGDSFGRHGAGWAQGWPHALAGRYEQAERAAEAALGESAGSGQPDALAFYGAQLCVIRWDQGRLGELADAIMMQASTPEGLPAHRALGALALAEGGRLEEATALVDAAAADGFAMPVDGIYLTGLLLWGEVAVLCDRPAGADVLLERILPWREQVAFTGLAVHGCAARIAGELAALLDRDDAGEHFALAAQVHDRLQAPALTARTHAGWARWLWRRGEQLRARDHALEAHRAAEVCGCPQLAGPAAVVS